LICCMSQVILAFVSAGLFCPCMISFIAVRSTRNTSQHTYLTSHKLQDESLLPETSSKDGVIVWCAVLTP
jgi:hypothetical protein